MSMLHLTVPAVSSDWRETDRGWLHARVINSAIKPTSQFVQILWSEQTNKKKLWTKKLKLLCSTHLEVYFAGKISTPRTFWSNIFCVDCTWRQSRWKPETIISVHQFPHYHISHTDCKLLGPPKKNTDLLQFSFPIDFYPIIFCHWLMIIIFSYLTLNSK